MRVTDDQVAALRAQLKGDSEEHGRLLDKIEASGDQIGYTALVAGAFFEAVDRRFDVDAPHDSIIEFVASVRSASEVVRDQVDPTVAERMIRHSLGHGSVDDIDDNTVIGTQMILIAALVADEQFDAIGLDRFLSTARQFGDRMLGRRSAD